MPISTHWFPFYACTHITRYWDSYADLFSHRLPSQAASECTELKAQAETKGAKDWAIKHAPVDYSRGFTYYYILLHTITIYYILLHTYYYNLLHTITYYYNLLHTITYILLQSIAYYYILLHTITTVRQDSAKRHTHTSMMGGYKGIQGYGSIN